VPITNTKLLSLVDLRRGQKEERSLNANTRHSEDLSYQRCPRRFLKTM